jgi:hypothetical protein
VHKAQIYYPDGDELTSRVMAKTRNLRNLRVLGGVSPAWCLAQEQCIQAGKKMIGYSFAN